MAGRLRSGDAILVRHVHFGRVYNAVPARVVEHGARRAAWWIAPETPCVYPDATAPDGALLPVSQWSTRPHSWYGNGNLDVVDDGAWHGVRHFWNDDRTFRGWYVNIQSPVRRTPAGFDFRDLALDVLVAPDLTWELKDEDHLEQGEAMGFFSAEEVHRVHEERDRVLARLDALFPTGWEDWRPDPSWPVPSLPPKWDAV